MEQCLITAFQLIVCITKNVIPCTYNFFFYTNKATQLKCEIYVKCSKYNSDIMQLIFESS